MVSPHNPSRKGQGSMGHSPKERIALGVLKITLHPRVVDHSGIILDLTWPTGSMPAYLLQARSVALVLALTSG